MVEQSDDVGPIDRILKSTEARHESSYIGLSRAKEILDEVYPVTWLVRILWALGMITAGVIVSRFRVSAFKSFVPDSLWLIPCLSILSAFLVDTFWVKRGKKKALEKYAVAAPFVSDAAIRIARDALDVYKSSSGGISKKDFNLNLGATGMSIKISGESLEDIK